MTWLAWLTFEDADAMAVAMGDAPSVWDDSVPPGGYVCGSCGMPVESEPCRDHQRWAAEGGSQS